MGGPSVVFGARTPSEETESMRAIARDMLSENLEVILSPDIRRDAMVKFSYVSPIGRQVYITMPRQLIFSRNARNVR